MNTFDCSQSTQILKMPRTFRLEDGSNRTSLDGTLLIDLSLFLPGAWTETWWPLDEALAGYLPREVSRDA